MGNILIQFILLVYSINLYAQKCEAFFPLEQGTVFELTNYDKKDKVSGKSLQKVINKSINGNDNISVEVEMINYDDKDEELSRAKYKVKCENGKFYFDMNLYFDQEHLKAYKDMDVEVDAEFLEFPPNMQKGNKLKDGKITITVSTSVMTIATLKVEITERIVDAIEDVTTPAGTFNCTKISYKVFTKIGFVKVNTTVTEWYAKGIGIVKSESYNKMGKYLSKSILTKFN